MNSTPAISTAANGKADDPASVLAGSSGPPEAPGRKLSTALFRAIVIITAFNVLSALGGGVGILVSGGLGMPPSMLATSPFDTFVGPGLILAIAIGGTQALAFVLLCARREPALLWTAVAGFGMLIWIFIETGIIAGLSWLQVVYFATGIAQIALVLALLGIVSWLPRAALRRAVADTRG
jgi:hypothetical protein